MRWVKRFSFALLLSGIGTAVLSDPVLADLVSTSEVNLVRTLSCNNSDQAEYDCFNVKATIDADDPDTDLDNALLPTNVVLSIRYKKGIPLTNRWVVFEAGGHGSGYGPSFGNVSPGNYVLGGWGYGDDLIRWYNERGYVTLDVVWECANGGPCLRSLATWVPEYSQGTGWYRNTGGAGYIGVSSRTKAIVKWAMANNGGQRVGAHGQSSGSGRLMTVLTRYQGESLFDTVVFDGGPVFAYIPWYCGITSQEYITNPNYLGSKPSEFDIEAYDDNFRLNYDNARDTNNGEGTSPYRNCTNHIWDETAMMADSNFYQATDRDFSTIDIAVVLGKLDTTPASPHARLWFHGYQAVPPLSAKSLTIRQGYCSDPTNPNATYFANMNSRPCTDWQPANFPTATSVTYDSQLVSAGHPTAQNEGGANVLLSTMLATLEPTLNWLPAILNNLLLD